MTCPHPRRKAEPLIYVHPDGQTIFGYCPQCSVCQRVLGDIVIEKEIPGWTGLAWAQMVEIGTHHPLRFKTLGGTVVPERWEPKIETEEVPF